jgi:hypothetical protein
MEKEVAVKASAPGAAAETKKPKPTPKAKLAPLSMVKESVELGTGSALEPGLAAVAPPPSTKNLKKPRQKGISVLKLNVNPGEEDTPSQPASTPAPLLLPTLQAKGKGSLTKLKSISVSSLSAPAAAAAPEPVAPLQQPEVEEQGGESEE